MTLREYLHPRTGTLSQGQLARLAQCNQGTLSRLVRWQRTGKRCSLGFALLIQAITRGEVTVEEMPLSPEAKVQWSLIQQAPVDGGV